MLEFIEFRGKKYPFLIGFSTLIAFQKQTGKDFTEILQNNKNLIGLAETLVLILKLGLKTGYDIKPPSLIQKIKNLICKGNFIGIKEQEYLIIIDEQWQKILSIVPKFFGSITDVEGEDKKK